MRFTFNPYFDQQVQESTHQTASNDYSAIPSKCTYFSLLIFRRTNGQPNDSEHYEHDLLVSNVQSHPMLASDRFMSPNPVCTHKKGCGQNVYGK